MATLIANGSEHIGQVRIKDAQAEVDRMNKQENTNEWHLDYSEQKYCTDEYLCGISIYEPYGRPFAKVNNPCTLREGYAWVTKSYTVIP